MTGRPGPLAAAVLSVAALWIAAPLEGQGMLRSAVSLGTLSDQGGGAGAASLYVRPALGFQAPYGRGVFHLQATPLARLHGPQLFDGALRTGELTFGGVHLSLGGRVETTQPAFERNTYGRADVDLRVATTSSSQGVSLGVGLLRATAPAAALNTPTARIGGWIRRLGISFSGEVTATQVATSGSSTGSGSSGGSIDSLTFDRFRADISRAIVDTPIVLLPPVTTSVAAARALMATQARFTLATRVAGMDIDAVGGAFLFSTVRNAPYGALTLTRWLTSDAAITGGLVQRVLDPVRGTSVRMAMLGIRMAVRGSPQLPEVDAFPADAAEAFRAVRSGEMVRFSIRAPGARTVALEGDATGWAVVQMERASHGRWTVAVRVPPGVYHVLVRLDNGAWTPPPGIPRGVDPYGGAVGVVVVN